MLTTPAVVGLAAARVRGDLPAATVMLTVICFKIVAMMFQLIVKGKVNLNIVLCTLFQFNYLNFQEFTGYIMFTNKNFIHRIDIRNPRLRKGFQTPLSGMDTVTSVDFDFRCESMQR